MNNPDDHRETFSVVVKVFERQGCSRLDLDQSTVMDSAPKIPMTSLAVKRRSRCHAE